MKKLLIFFLVLVSEQAPAQLGVPLFLGEVNGKLFFTSTHVYDRDYYKPNGLWVTDGTTGGTSRLMQIDSSLQDDWIPMGFPDTLRYCILGSKLIMSLRARTHNEWELWSSDGSGSGTHRLKSFGDSVQLLHFGGRKPLIFNGACLFTTTNFDGDVYLWRTDGTTAGTRIIKQLPSYASLGTWIGMPLDWVELNNAGYFIANSSINVMTLWKTDGTEGGTVVVKNIPTPVGISTFGFSGEASIQVMNDRLYFPRLTDSHTYEVWFSDGTTAGTHVLTDFPSGPVLTKLGNVVPVNGKYFFISKYPLERRLYITDGTVAGTRLVKDLAPGGAFSIVGNTKSHVYFLARTVAGDPVLNFWISDGTEQGTFRVAGTNFDMNDGFERVAYDHVSTVTICDTMYFQIFNDQWKSQVWRTDGTIAGTYMFADSPPFLWVLPSFHTPLSFAHYNERLYYPTYIDGLPHSVNLPSCIDPNQAELSARLYPNPTTGKVVIEVRSVQWRSYEKIDLVVYDMSGNRIRIQNAQWNTANTELSFETSSLNAGVYFAVLSTGKEKITKKFVVAR